MRRPGRTQRLEEATVAVADLFVYAKASLQIRVLEEEWLANRCNAPASWTKGRKSHVRENDYAVFC